MKKAMVCALCGAMMVGVSVSAAEKSKKKPSKDTATTRPAATRPVKSMHGDLLKLDIEQKTIVVRTRTGAETTVQTDAGTEFLLDSEPVTLVDLVAGMKVSVTPETGVATRVSARSVKNR